MPPHSASACYTKQTAQSSRPHGVFSRRKVISNRKMLHEGRRDGRTDGCLSRGARTFRLVWNFSCPYDNSPWARPSRTSSCSGVGHCLEHPTLLYKIEASSTVTSALFHINMDSLFASYGDDSSGSDEEKQQPAKKAKVTVTEEESKPATAPSLLPVMILKIHIYSILIVSSILQSADDMFADDSLLGEASDFLKQRGDAQDDGALDLGETKRAQDARARAAAVSAKGPCRHLNSSTVR
jgi:hypothetical protein